MEATLRHSSALFFHVILIALGTLAGCGTRALCDPSSCLGCCNSQGQCETGTNGLACGVGGATCVQCDIQQVCQLGLCNKVSGTGGGSGGTGGGSGGGNTGGGTVSNTDGGAGGNTGGGTETITGTGTFQGSVAGNALPVQDVFAVTLDPPDRSFVGTIIGLGIKPNLCSQVKSLAQFKNTNLFDIILIEIDSQGNSVSPTAGLYTVTSAATGSGRHAFASFATLNAACVNTLSDSSSFAKSGTVQVTQLDGFTGGRVAGTFQMTVGSQQDPVSGWFDAALCGSIPNAALACSP